MDNRLRAGPAIRLITAALSIAFLGACSAPEPGPGTPVPTGQATGPPGAPTERSPAPVPPTATTTPVPQATPTPYAGSIDQPFPLGMVGEWTSPDGIVLAIEITEAYRGWAARRAVLEHGEPQAAAPEGFEWFYFRASLEYTGADRGPIALDAGFWRAVSEGTTTTFEDAPVCCLAPAFDFTLQPGETRSGVLALLVPVDEPAPLLAAGGEAGIHFAASADTLTATDVLFEDDFSTTGGGWQQIDRDANGITDYDQGGFRILVDRANYDYWVNPGLEFADVRVEVDATRIGGPEDNVFGLICRYVDDANFYFFLVASDGYYAVGKYTAGDYTLIGSDLMVPTDAVLPGEETNHLRAECVGETLRLFVNGVQLTEVTDPDHPTGDVGLIAGTFDEPGTDVVFDYFAVLEP